MQPNPMMKHLEGMPPFLMMQMEARLKVRIRQHLGDTYYSVGQDYVDNLAHWMLHRLMEKRMNDGRQFDSILAASTKAFGHMMINNLRGENDD